MPSVLEIMTGIQKEEKKNQLKLNSNQNPKFILAVTSNMQEIWRQIFRIDLVIDFQKPLTDK